MATVRQYHDTEAIRRQANDVEDGYLGTTSDGREGFAGNPATPLGYPFTYPQVPLHGLDVRRLWTVASQGQSDTWTNENGDVVDASGMVMTPRIATGVDTDPVARGYIRPYELADGGEVVIQTYGTYKCGSLSPKIVARLTIGGERVFPDYGLDQPLLPGFDPVSGVVSQAFDWSYSTLGSNVLGGYEALSSARTNTPQGLFQWRLTTRIRSLGRYAKLETMDDDAADWSSGTDYTVGAVVRDTATANRTYRCLIANGPATTVFQPNVTVGWEAYWQDISGNLAVEMTLDWGALHYNPGDPFSFSNPFSNNTNQYSTLFDNTAGTQGVKRGSVYSFLGRQWLCHASSLTSATSGGSKGAWATNRNTATDMLVEQAPGMGMHWKEFFVPLVQSKTYTAFAQMNHVQGNELILELGGPAYVDPALSPAAYSATSDYFAESGTCTDGGNTYVAKVFMDYDATPANSAYIHMDGGAVSLLMRAAPTAAVSGSVSGDRFWRQLAANPEDRFDDMRMQHTQAYLFGGRVGAYQERTR